MVAKANDARWWSATTRIPSANRRRRCEKEQPTTPALSVLSGGCIAVVKANGIAVDFDGKRNGRREQAHVFSPGNRSKKKKETVDLDKFPLHPDAREALTTWTEAFIIGVPDSDSSDSDSGVDSD